MRDTPQSKQEEHERIFSRLLHMLPEPTPLSEVIDDVRANLTMCPNAMVGEVGLDRIFRVPFDYFAEQRELTPFTIPFEHQVAVLETQFDLAVELKRNVSVHSVKAQCHDSSSLLSCLLSRLVSDLPCVQSGSRSPLYTCAPVHGPLDSSSLSPRTYPLYICLPPFRRCPRSVCASEARS